MENNIGQIYHKHKISTKYVTVAWPKRQNKISIKIYLQFQTENLE